MISAAADCPESAGAGEMAGGCVQSSLQHIPYSLQPDSQAGRLLPAQLLQPRPMSG